MKLTKKQKIAGAGVIILAAFLLMRRRKSLTDPLASRPGMKPRIPQYKVTKNILDTNSDTPIWFRPVIVRKGEILPGPLTKEAVHAGEGLIGANLIEGIRVTRATGSVFISKLNLRKVP